MIKKIALFIFACVLVSSVSLAKVPSTGIVDSPVAGAAYTNLSKAATLGAIARIGQNVFKCVTNVSTFPAFQGEPAFLETSSADGYSVIEYRSTAQYGLFEGIWYCNQYGSPTIESAQVGGAANSKVGGGIGWIQVGGVANAFVSGEGTDITANDYLAPTEYQKATTGKTIIDTVAKAYLIRGGAAITSAGNELMYPTCFEAKVNTLTAINSGATKKVYLGNRAGR